MDATGGYKGSVKFEIGMVVTLLNQTNPLRPGCSPRVSGPALKVVEEYLESVKKYPNPPAPNITRF